VAISAKVSNENEYNILYRDLVQGTGGERGGEGRRGEGRGDHHNYEHHRQLLLKNFPRCSITNINSCTTTTTTTNSTRIDTISTIK
jgi:hypothetical protein